jgi:hypothetical protein
MRTFAILAAVGVLGAAAALTATASASGVGATDTPTGESSLVEDFEHPNQAAAAAVGMTLKKGNGKIFWVDCAQGGDLLKVESDSITAPGNTACFRVTGVDGYLAMSIESTYFIRGDSHKIQAKLTGVHNGQEITREYSIKPNTMTPVGEPVYPDDGPAALVELRSVA